MRPAIKVGLSTAAVYPLRTEAAFEYAARLGYDGVELMVWAETVSQAQLNQFRAALGRSGFLVILVGTDDGTMLAGEAVSHVCPAGLDLGLLSDAAGPADRLVPQLAY